MRIVLILFVMSLSSCALLENCQNYSEESERKECVARHEYGFFSGGNSNQASHGAMDAANAAGAAASNHIHHHTPAMIPGM